MSVKLTLLIVTSMLISLSQSKLILEKVFILNRHSLRAPLSKNLYNLSPKSWPQWFEKPGFLSAKGVRLAGFMGSYFAAWLKEEGVLSANCPGENDLYVLANTKERTLTSALSFVEKGFPDCNINVHHSGINISDPLFNPVIHNTSAAFTEHAIEDMNEALDAVDLTQAYELLNHVLDYKHSISCEVDKKCNLTEGKNQIRITSGLKPQLSGPLKSGNDVADAFLMQYYEGFPIEDVAWGQLNDSISWKTVVELRIAYINVTYKTKLIAKDISDPLIKYMTEMFLDGDNKPKVTILFCHDVNIHTVFKTLLVKPYSLKYQDETIPIGSAVVFQKWRDDENQKSYLKMSFVYQSTEQLRDVSVLSLDDPPQVETLELEKCSVDENGLCPWDDFKIFIDSL